MLITVVNRSEYTDESVQEVIRAVNRQINEDFRRYWHRSAELRLEGRIGSRPVQKRLEELRGEAILYLMDDVEQQSALGYHDINVRGIPFGFVFTRLSERMGEPWSVTLSHEALELLMDPEANLLVRGPHPEDPERYVYHWYEMCDAVQGRWYEVDGVSVSNFVLPLYFTEDNESGSRNDFMGDQCGDDAVPSFGVAPGGYIGFYDPETDRHEEYFSEEKRAQARKRWREKAKAGIGRRAVRRRWEASPEPSLRRILGTGAGEPPPGPWFEGYCVDVQPRGNEDPFDVLDAAATSVLGRGWQRRWHAVEPAEPIPGRSFTAYELVPKGHQVAIGDAWEIVYALRTKRGVIDVEPDFVLFHADSDALENLPPSRRWALFGSGDLDGSEECEWSLEQINAVAAWTLTKGAGISIGHPDTGFLPHPEIWPGDVGGPIDTIRDYDFVGDEDDAHAEPNEDDALPAGPNHGTGTASVLVSKRGPADAKSLEFVSGVAPEATLVPLRVGNSPVHFSMRRVRKAIEYATRMGFHVLSMSLGGPFSNRHLEDAIREARRNGLVLIAAAGNYIPFKPVIWPARYPDVVAVAACNVDRKAWDGSSRGESVDITAPGESVWRALVNTDVPEGSKDRYRVERSEGTSYATAHVAGVCALWLAHHGPDVLRAHYGEYLSDAFRYVIADTAQPSEDLDPETFGGGIIDADATLRRPLPSKRDVVNWVAGDGRAARAARAKRAGAGRGASAPSGTSNTEQALDAIAALLPHLERDEVFDGLASLFDTNASGVRKHLAEVGDELALRMASDPGLRRQFSSRCRASGRVRGAKATTAKLRSAGFAEMRGRVRRDTSKRLAERLE